MFLPVSKISQNRIENLELKQCYEIFNGMLKHTHTHKTITNKKATLLGEEAILVESYIKNCQQESNKTNSNTTDNEMAKHIIPEMPE